MKGLRLVLLAQLAFFALWAGLLIGAPRQDVGDIYLETEPVDPRDLLSGTYVALSYPIGNARTCSGLPGSFRRGTVYVSLSDKGRRAATPSGQVVVHEADGCALEKPRSGVWARGNLAEGRGGRRVVFGIERFFLNENDPLKDARSGSVLAQVRPDRYGGLRLNALVRKD
ncbi:MAG: GDYXXLXY domain-containing protein [Elusimicrobia bacterium]|nr:GDYXXLXY domain-containing protein [Elusimicrobiota bacterium]